MKALKALQGVVAAHLIQEHPEDPGALVVGDGVITVMAAVDLDEGTLRVGMPVLRVIRFQASGEVDAGTWPLGLLEKEHRREVGHPFREDIPAWAFSRRQDVSPPLVRSLVSRDLEGEVDSWTVPCQEADPL